MEGFPSASTTTGCTNLKPDKLQRRKMMKTSAIREIRSAHIAVLLQESEDEDEIQELQDNLNYYFQ
ncbi:hypothetical protein C4D60_Mb00t16930 [Musa balbisiana]|uniref:Uncharacterized protein n=1 Tax=Musa balbisiana TaxID=52838 RepID=A0A4S8I899_MUSBA|nr:hypothetical protein C4D60_Mb00t16930 [Musa balbisiana]